MQQYPHSRGFTLIELMIVVAIIGILAAVALPAYQNYIDTANAGRLNAHYESGIRFARSEYHRIRTDISVGAVPVNAASDRVDSTAEWVALMALEVDGALAPEGGPAFIAGAGNAQLGAVGVALTQGTVSGADLIVTFTRPAYGTFAGASVESTMVCWQPDAPACA